MHRSDNRTLFTHGIEHTRVHRAAGVQHNSPAELFFADTRQLLRNNGDFVIGCGDQDHPRSQNLPGHSRTSFPCSNEAHGPPRARFAAGNDRANLPSQFAQPASQRSSYASRPDDGQAIRHPVLG
jgi:hypothetical protein